MLFSRKDEVPLLPQGCRREGWSTQLRAVCVLTANAHQFQVSCGRSAANSIDTPFWVTSDAVAKESGVGVNLSAKYGISEAI